MTLGEIIRQYGEDHSISQLIKDSGLSKAYVYMLMNNKNNKGEPIVPSIETIKKVAEGMHTDFEDVFNKLDYDFEVRVNGSDAQYYESQQTAKLAQDLFKSKEMKLLFDAAKDSKPEDLQMAADLLMRLKGTNSD